LAATCRLPRPRILPKNMEMLLFIKYNLMAIGYGAELPQPPSDWSPPKRTRYHFQRTLLRNQKLQIHIRRDTLARGVILKVIGK
jgi:hypothetical protein